MIRVTTILVLALSLAGCDFVKAWWSNTSGKLTSAAREVPAALNEKLVEGTGNNNCEAALRAKYGVQPINPRFIIAGGNEVTCVTDSTGKVVRFDEKPWVRPPPPEPTLMDLLKK